MSIEDNENFNKPNESTKKVRQYFTDSDLPAKLQYLAPYEGELLIVPEEIRNNISTIMNRYTDLENAKASSTDLLRGIQQTAQSKAREKAQERADVERRHQEQLESNNLILNAVSEAITQGKSVTFKIEGSTIHGGVQQNIDSIGNSQYNNLTKGLNIEELITTLKELFKYLPEEDKEDANEVLADLQDTVNANEEPKKSLLRFAKSLVKKAIENPVGTVKGVNTIATEGEKAVNTIKEFLA